MIGISTSTLYFVLKRKSQALLVDLCGSSLPYQRLHAGQSRSLKLTLCFYIIFINGCAIETIVANSTMTVPYQEDISSIASVVLHIKRFDNG